MKTELDINTNGRIEATTELKDSSILKSEHLSDPSKNEVKCDFLYTLDGVEITLLEYNKLLDSVK